MAESTLPLSKEKSTTTTTTITTVPDAEQEQPKDNSTPSPTAPIRVNSGSMIHYLQIIKAGSALTNEERCHIARQARDLIWGQIKTIRKYKLMAKHRGTTRLHVGTNMTLYYKDNVFEGHINSSHC